MINSQKDLLTMTCNNKQKSLLTKQAQLEPGRDYTVTTTFNPENDNENVYKLI